MSVHVDPRGIDGFRHSRRFDDDPRGVQREIVAVEVVRDHELARVVRKFRRRRNRRRRRRESGLGRQHGVARGVELRHHRDADRHERTAAADARSVHDRALDERFVPELRRIERRARCCPASRGSTARRRTRRASTAACWCRARWDRRRSCGGVAAASLPPGALDAWLEPTDRRNADGTRHSETTRARCS